MTHGVVTVLLGLHQVRGGVGWLSPEHFLWLF